MAGPGREGVVQDTFILRPPQARRRQPPAYRDGPCARAHRAAHFATPLRATPGPVTPRPFEARPPRPFGQPRPCHAP